MIGENSPAPGATSRLLRGRSPAWLRGGVLGLGLGLLGPAAAAEAAPREPEGPVVLVDWRSDEGIRRLERSAHKLDFFQLANQFESQTNRVFCGPTSATIVLNALRLENPERSKPVDRSLLQEGDLDHLPPGALPLFERYTQNGFFSEDVEQLKSRSRVMGEPVGERRDVGFQLRQLHAVLRELGLDVELHVADEALSEDAVRKLLRENLATRDDYVIVNYLRRKLGQSGGGHISPLGAYDETSDSFLVLDVNPNRAPWVWVRTRDLVAAMRTHDTIENRGFLLVREGARDSESDSESDSEK